MGAHSPAVVLSGETAAEVMKTIILPAIQGMSAEGRPYTGVLYAGLMLTADGPKVLEFNCRFGDPETQVQMLRLEDDLAELFLKATHGNLGDTKLTWRKEAAACVVMAQERAGLGVGAILILIGLARMNWRWLMHTTCNWFKIMNTKSVRKIITVPTNHIKRMCSINKFVHHSFFFYFDYKVSFFIMRF